MVAMDLTVAQNLTAANRTLAVLDCRYAVCGSAVYLRSVPFLFYCASPGQLSSNGLRGTP
jgi:hypothetical protein